VRSQGPLTGVRVIDFTIWVQGPLASALLADMGADVIKVERTGGGDPLRNVISSMGDDGMRTRNLPWEVCNRNKRSLTLDLGQEAGREALHRLASESDVFLTNLQPKTLKQLGVDEDAIRAANPRIVYARGGGFGELGPLAGAPCQDTIGMAYSGFMFTSSSKLDEPYYPPGAMTDVVSGTFLAMGVLAAIVERERTGVAPPVTTSLLQSMIWLQTLTIAGPANGRGPSAPTNRATPSSALMNTYKAADGRWVAIGLPLMVQWPIFIEAVDLTELADDPRFGDPTARARNGPELVRVLEAQFAKRPAQEWWTACSPESCGWLR
jgi:crotonobetainyl-CoA:carnitine CoA-transferase CaiB-like acyl-CoA transferase